MGVELVIRTGSLTRAAARAAKRTLRATCLVPGHGVHLDRIDVQEQEAQVVQDGQAVLLRLPVDVFLVTDAALHAAPNAVPDGAHRPHRVVLVHELGADVRVPAHGGTVLDRSPVVTVTARDPDLGPLGDALGPAADPVRAMLRQATSLDDTDLTALVAGLGIPPPHTGRVDLGDGAVAFRFDATGPATARLAADQAWGLFLSGATWADLLTARVDASVRAAEPGATVQATWRTDGATPGVELRIGIGYRIEVSGVLGIGAGIDVDARVDVRTSLSIVTPSTLRVSATWSTHLDVTAVPSVVTDLVTDLVADSLDPVAFGGTPTGPRAFTLDTALPPFTFAGVTLRAESVWATAAGATLGGRVIVPPVGEPAFRSDVSVLGGPTRVQLCSVLARSGSGAPDTGPLTAANTASYGQVRLEGVGQLCRYEVVSPSAAAAVHVRVVPGVGAEELVVRARIPSSEAAAMTAPLRVVVHTTRGVRLFDLGRAPRIEVDGAGTIVGGGTDLVVDNCLHVVPGDDAAVTWGDLLGEGPGWTIDTFRPPPLEDPSWSDFTAGGHGLSVQLVRLSQLEPGELVRFRSASHAIDVTADDRGRAVVPVLVRLEDTVAPARLERLNRRSLTGHVGVTTVDFEPLLTLPPSDGEPALDVSPGGRVTLSTTVGDRTVIDAVEVDGRWVRVTGGGSLRTDGATALNPQPLPPEPPEVRERLGLPDVVDVLALPGLEGRPVAVAVMRDGEKLLLDVHRDGSMRVAGTFQGPIGRLQVVGDRALAVGDAATSVLAVTR